MGKHQKPTKPRKTRRSGLPLPATVDIGIPGVSEAAEAAEPVQGRPSEWRPEMVEQARIACKLGATDHELAEAWGVCRRTVYRWRIEHPELVEAMAVGKDHADERVMRSLYLRAVGYSFESEKIFNDKDNGISRAPCVEHVPPDTVAAIFWLKNRRSDDWRDRKEVTGANGQPLQAGGVFVVPGVVTEEDWAKASEAQQSALAEGERKAAGNGTPP